MDTVDSVLNIDANGHSRNIEDWKVVGWGDADYRSPDCQTGVFQALRRRGPQEDKRGKKEGL